MAIMIGEAAQNEYGGITGGRKGDQTGREVRLREWCDFGQSAVYRWKSRTYAKIYAKIIRAWCNNPRIGYSQGSNRNGLYTAVRNRGWKYNGITVNCDCDCSAMVIAGVNCTVGKALLGANHSTRDLGDALMKTGLFVRLSGNKYCGQDAYLMEGDILNCPGKHVVTVLQNGARAELKSRFTLSGVNHPLNLKKGQSYVLGGTILSDLPLSRVEIGVVSGKTGKWMKQKYDAKVSGKSFKISKADPVIKFGNLHPGIYYYRCWCWDRNGATKVFDYKFIVK